MSGNQSTVLLHGPGWLMHLKEERLTQIFSSTRLYAIDDSHPARLKLNEIKGDHYSFLLVQTFKLMQASMK